MTINSRFAQFGLTCWRGAPEVMVGIHRHNDIELNYVKQGNFSYWLGGSCIEVTARRTLLFWAAVPHRVIDVAPDTRFYWLTLPLNTFLSWRIEALIQPTLQGEALLDHLNEDDLRLFQQWSEDARGNDNHKQILLLELQARLRRMALARRTNPITHHHPNSVAEHMARWIAEHHTEPIHIDDIARAVNLHPNYAMRIFQEAFGRSINDTLVQFRVSTAQRLLVTTSLSATDVAYQSGFGSVSRFYAVFKAWCGQSPTEYRSQLAL